ncbi:hypothetical protein [Aneurinibacillus tyrosinisolvens]|uniref:hypothetical protein n=1 Tax=Aneurinibacillus tyrosinisolvens TaxID=1443435 RepID=UPI00063F5AB5|nr:hypothetical protein [Aneurinibacillus tyrosinisolvens]
MDHVINGIMQYLDIEIGYLREQWESGQYYKLSDCPSYKECKAMVDAIHVLEKYYYGKHVTMSVKEMVKF